MENEEARLSKSKQSYGSDLVQLTRGVWALYSVLSASMGLTVAALCAGKKLAARDAAASTTATVASVGMSHAATPKSSLPPSMAAPMAHAIPIPTPAAVNQLACLITML
jgi:hypothetical protein